MRVRANNNSNNKFVANTTSSISQSEIPASAYLNGTEGPSGGRLHVYAKFLAAAKVRSTAMNDPGSIAK